MKKLVFRWLAGAGGDTVLYLLSTQNDVYMNITPHLNNYDIRTGGSDKMDPAYPHLVKGNKTPQKEYTNLFVNEIKRLSKEKQSFIIKSHYFYKEFDEQLKDIVNIVDLGFDQVYLPFVVNSNIIKTDTVEWSKLPDKTFLDPTLWKLLEKASPHEHKSVITWCVVKNHLECIRKYNLDQSPVLVNDMFERPNLTEEYFKSQGYNLSFDTEYFHLWNKINLPLLPSDQYKEYLKSKQYNYQDKSLNLVERYIFLALSGRNFQFL